MGEKAYRMLGEIETGRVVDIVLKITRQRSTLLRFAEEFLEWSDVQANYSITEVHNIAALRDMAEKAIECCDE